MRWEKVSMSEMGADLVASKTFSILTLERLFELLI